MSSAMIAVLVGVLLIGVGIANRKGNISSLHSYHRHRVTKEDRIPFGKRVGLSMIIIGCSVTADGILTAVTIHNGNEIFMKVGIVIMVAGLVAGLIMCFAAMIKYNKGIF